jgi:hypothetical protein
MVLSWTEKILLTQNIIGMKKIIFALICIFAMFGLSSCDCLWYMCPPPPHHHHHCEISVSESGISAPEAEFATISTEDASSEATSSVS